MAYSPAELRFFDANYSPRGSSMSVVDVHGEAVSIQANPFAELARSVRSLIGGSRIKRRDYQMLVLYRAGFEMPEIARDFGLHKSSVSRGIRRASRDFLKAAASRTHDG